MLAPRFPALNEIEALLQRHRHHRRRRGGVDIGPRALDERFDHFRLARDEGTEYACRLAQRRHVDHARGPDAEMREYAASFRSQHAEAVSIVEEQPGIVA